MKNKIYIVIILILSITLIVVVRKEKKTNYSFAYPKEEEPEKNPIKIKLLDEITGNITEIDLEEYIIGVVASEMPASFEEEALKAQAVAARTYAMYKKATRKEAYDLIIGTKDQAYQTNEQLFQKWNIDFFPQYLKIRNAVLSTQNEILTYNGEVINAFYFSMSNGQTENSELVFSEELPYLKSVESKWDNENIPNYQFEKIISQEEFCQNLQIDCQEITINNIIKSDSNRILEITINGQVFKGTKVRSLLGLRSTDFTIEKQNDEIKITTKGYGHGVGMSQYGANGMAKEGQKYQDILKHYYTNTNISQIS